MDQGQALTAHEYSRSVRWWLHTMDGDAITGANGETFPTGNRRPITILLAGQQMPGRYFQGNDFVNAERFTGNALLTETPLAAKVEMYNTSLSEMFDLRSITVAWRNLESLRLAVPHLATLGNAFIFLPRPGIPVSAIDVDELVWHAIAAHLGKWHGLSRAFFPEHSWDNTACNPTTGTSAQVENIWSRMNRWVMKLPEHSSRRAMLQERVKECQQVLRSTSNPANVNYGWNKYYVRGHCNLNKDNVIINEGSVAGNNSSFSTLHGPIEVIFTSYCHVHNCPPAFDVVNFFLLYSSGKYSSTTILPGKEVRRRFISIYLRSFYRHVRRDDTVETSEIEAFLNEVDRYRPIPGLYWATYLFALSEVKPPSDHHDYVQDGWTKLGESVGWERDAYGVGPDGDVEARQRDEWARE